MSACVVSAFYRIPSKHSVKHYFEWIMPFFSECPFPLVLFTEPELVDVFQEIRKRFASQTKIVGLPFSEFKGIQRYGAEMWVEEKKKDHEASHTPELYCTWYEKKEFVRKAIEMCAFDAEKFVWCDAGILRFVDWIPMLQTFPLANRIEKGKMTFLQIVEFTKEDTWEKDFQYENHIGGGIQAADKDTWLWWYDEYDRMLQIFLETKKFVGKDQNILASCYLANPDKFTLVVPPSSMDGFSKWFWLLLWLSGKSDFP
jgi:hypothetical protein